MLEGRIEVPIAVGTKGGSLAAHETFKWALQLLGNPDSATLAEVMACVGLAQVRCRPHSDEIMPIYG